MSERLTVRLVGGGPWGFRLQGGSGAPLTVSKVRRKSRAQHHLLEGDRILSINGVPCDNFSYDQAMNVVDAADNSLKIEILRGGAGGKENRDPSAPTYQPKEVTVKEKVTPQVTTYQTKPKEPVTKPPEVQESRGLGPQAQRQPETTSHPPPTAVKAPPPPPPPKPFLPSAAAAPQPWAPEPLSLIPQIASSTSEITSSVRQVTSSVSEVRSVRQESVLTSSLPPEAPPLPWTDFPAKAPEPFKAPEVTSAFPEVTSAFPEVTSAFPEAPPPAPAPAPSQAPLPPPTWAPMTLQAAATAATSEVTSSVSLKKQEVAPQPVQKPEPFSQPIQKPEPFSQPIQKSEPFSQPIQKPEPFTQPIQKPEPFSQPVQKPEPFTQPIQKPEPFSQPIQKPEPFSQPIQKPEPFSQMVQKPEAVIPEARSLIQGLAPELQALAPELAALETELAAFRTGPQPGDVQRRQEVSVETTSEGQRYHSLTSEKSAWSAGPQHKASSFQQVEETREVSRADHDAARRVETVKAETKKEVVRTSRTEVTSSSAQNQLSPESKTDALSWRPTSPIFSQPILPPGGAGGSAPIAAAPGYQVKKAPVQEAPPPAVWTPPSASSSPGPASHQQYQQQHQKESKKKKAPPTLPKPARKGQSTHPRPTSAPPRDFDIWDPFSDSELVCKDSSARGKASGYSALTSVSSGAVSDSEDWHHAYTSEDEMGSTSLYTRRKKMFSSSSFYEEPYCKYPTVEEQVELARKIAGSLSNDNNKKSKGANMFFKRVKRSHTWIHEGPDPYSDGGTTDTDMEPTTPDPGSAPYIKVSSGPPKLKLILDPRQLQDLVKLRNSGLNPVEHTAVSPDICLDLVRDLNSPRGKGAALFAKRKQKAEEWVVDEERVKQQMAQKEAEVAQLYEREQSWPQAATAAAQNRLKMIKSPWEAALESPIGSCDAAFVELPPVVSSVASSIIRAAENKARITPAAPAYSEPPFALQPDVYKPKAPRGWVGPATGSVPSFERNPSPMPLSREAPAAPLGGTRASSGAAPRPFSFHDFNTTARSWPGNQAPLSRANFRHVTAPAVRK